MFDAGAIEARLTVDTSPGDKSLSTFEARVKAFEDRKHEVKISAVFDNSSMSRARQAFTNLDNQISKDAMSRLRSSPQGSVLGALNALFSPHPVTGAPSPQQSAQSGLLGKMISSPGGGGPTTARTSKSTVATVLGVNDTQLKSDAAKAGRDAADSANKAAADEANKKGSGWLGGLLGGIGGFVASHIGGGGSSGGGGGGSRGSFLGNLAGGIGPGILGLGAKTATAVGLGGSLLGAVPAVGALGAGLGVIGGGAALLISQDKQVQDSAKSMLSGIEKTVTAAAQPLVAPLLAAFSQIPRFFASIGPALRQTFAAAAPLIAPFVSGIEMLVKNLLPGLTAILRAAQPAFAVFAQILGTLGKDLGQMFTAFAPVIAQSSTIFKALLDVLSGLFPIVGKLAAIFASALAPVFVQFAGVIKALEPALTLVGKVLASLAGAVIGDLVAAFGAVASLVKATSPALTLFATALSQVFTTLENSGAFAVLGDALESLTAPLANLINALVGALIPAMPLMLRVVTDLINAGIVVLVRVIGDLATGITWLVNKMPALVPIIIGVIAALKAWQAAQLILNAVLDANPIGLVITAIGLLVVAGVELANHWSAVWGAIKSVAQDAWNFVYNGFGKYLLPLLGPAGAIALAAIELYQHWNTIWGDIKAVITAVIAFFTTSWATITSNIRSAWNAIASFFSTWWANLEGAWRSAVSTVESVLSGAWNTIYGAIRTVWGTIVGYFKNTVAAGIEQALNIGKALFGIGSTILNQFLAGVKSVGSAVLNFFKSIGSGIVNTFKTIFGIASPSKVFYDLGRHLIQGLVNGLTGSASAAKGAIVAVGGNVAGWISQALAKAGAPQNWAPLMEILVSKESGGNPAAVNPISVGGEHATGIAQTLPSTFAQYSLGGSIYDPVADLVASIRYIMATYGSPYNIPGLTSGNYVGYAGGGIIPEPVIGYGLGSGSLYTFGEQGSEMVTPLGGMRGGDGASIAGVCARLDQLHSDIQQHIATTAAVPAGVGRHVGNTINQSASDASFRNRYPRGGA